MDLLLIEVNGSMANQLSLVNLKAHSSGVLVVVKSHCNLSWFHLH